MQVEDALILSEKKQAVKRENLYMRFIYELSVNTVFFESFCREEEDAPNGAPLTLVCGPSTRIVLSLEPHRLLCR